MRHRWGLYAVKSPHRSNRTGHWTADCLIPAPIENIHLLVTIHGLIADVKCNFVFTNFLTRPAKCLFIFPLVHNAVLDSCVAWVGEKFIYQRCDVGADDEDEHGLILEQSSSDMAKLQLGTVYPGTTIQVELKYALHLVINEQTLVKFIFPTYIPREFQGAFRASQVGRSPQLVPQFHCQALISGTYKVKQIMSREVLEVKFLDSYRQNVKIVTQGYYQPDRDFVFNIEYNGLTTPHIHIHKPINHAATGASALLQHHVAHLTLHHRPTQIAGRGRTLEFIICVDRSVSMHGTNLDFAREAVHFFLRNLKSGNYFNVIGFGSGVEPLFKSSQKITEHSLSQACRYKDKMRANMYATNVYALLKCLASQPAVSRHPKQIFIITDGAVENTQLCVDQVAQMSESFRFFTFGVGCTYSRHLVSTIARTGHGRAYHLGRAAKLLPHKVVESMRLASSPSIDRLGVTVRLPNGVMCQQLVSNTPSVLFPEETLSLFFSLTGCPEVIDTGAVIEISGVQSGSRVVKLLNFDLGDVILTEPAPLHRVVLRRTIESLEKDLGEARCADDFIELQDSLIRLGLLTNIATSQTVMCDMETAPKYAERPVSGVPLNFKRPENNPSGRSASVIIRFKHGIDIYSLDQCHMTQLPVLGHIIPSLQIDRKITEATLEPQPAHQLDYEDTSDMMVVEQNAADFIPLADIDSDSFASTLIDPALDYMSDVCESESPTREIFNVIEEHPDKGRGPSFIHRKLCPIHKKLGCPPLAECANLLESPQATSSKIMRPNSLHLELHGGVCASADKTTCSSGYYSMSSPPQKSTSEADSEMERQSQITYLKNRLSVIWQSIMSTKPPHSNNSESNTPLASLLNSATISLNHSTCTLNPSDIVTRSTIDNNCNNPLPVVKIDAIPYADSTSTDSDYSDSLSSQRGFEEMQLEGYAARPGKDKKRRSFFRRVGSGLARFKAWARLRQNSTSGSRA